MKERIDISIVIPTYNEAGSIEPLCDELSRVMSQRSWKYELLFIDDGSKDESFQLIRDRSKTDPHVRGVSLSRNFGHQIALLAGLRSARGDVVVSMDGDLQHPPETILAMHEAYRGGYDIVNTRRVDPKGTGIAKRSGSRCEWTSRTEKARYSNQARRYADVMAFEVECPDREEINLIVTCDALRQELRMSPRDVSRKSTVQYMEKIPPTNDGNYWRNIDFCAKFKVHQARPTSQLTVDLSCEDKAGNKGSGGTDFYYARLIQRNGQRAWSSPIWVEA